MTTKKTIEVKPMTVAEYFDAQVTLRQMTLAQLSKDIGGVLKPNMLSMIRSGGAKIPLNHVGRIARALGVDGMFFFKMCLQEYSPENWKAVKEIWGDQEVLTRNELALVRAIRKANPNNPKLTDCTERKFMEVVASLGGDNEQERLAIGF